MNRKSFWSKMLLASMLATSLLCGISHSQESGKLNKTLPIAPIEKGIPFRNNSDDYYGFKKETSIRDAVAQFNEKHSQVARQFEQAPLTEDEVIAALAIAQVHRPGSDGEFADACGAYARNRLLPFGAKLVLFTAADVGLPGREQEYMFWYVYISFNHYPAESGDWSYIEVPRPEHAAKMYKIPVRLVHRPMKSAQPVGK